MKKLVILLLSLVTVNHLALESYAITIKNGLDPKSPFAREYKNLNLKTFICKAACGCEETVTLTPGQSKTWQTAGCCPDYLNCKYTDAAGIEKTIETRPSWTAGKFDTMPTTGLGILCRDFGAQIVFDYEGALSLEELH